MIVSIHCWEANPSPLMTALTICQGWVGNACSTDNTSPLVSGFYRSACPRPIQLCTKISRLLPIIVSKEVKKVIPTIAPFPRPSYVASGSSLATSYGNNARAMQISTFTADDFDVGMIDVRTCRRQFEARAFEEQSSEDSSAPRSRHLSYAAICRPLSISIQDAWRSLYLNVSL